MFFLILKKKIFKAQCPASNELLMLSVWDVTVSLKKESDDVHSLQDFKSSRPRDI